MLGASGAGTGAERFRKSKLMRRGVILALAAAGLFAQTRFTYSKGQSVSPAYEGWMPNPDGSFTMYFGYMNTNWLEEFDIPIGPDNNIEPGGPDQGQPTHFYPRRNPFLFTIRVPKEFGNQELIWNLTTHGKTEKAESRSAFGAKATHRPKRRDFLTHGFNDSPAARHRP